MPVQIRRILGAHADDDVEKTEREGCIGAGQDGNVFIRLGGRPRADGIDGHQMSPVAPRLGNEAPGVVASRKRVIAPHDDELGAGQVFRVHAVRLSQGEGCSRHAGDRADRHAVLRGPERVP